MAALSCKKFTKNGQYLTLISLVMVASALSGCGDKAKATTQVAAKINSEEITISQVNNALANVPVTPGKTLDDAKQEVLGNLVIQNLAEQQAIKMKLDRNPAVMQAIESAKNTILARAYMDPIVAGIAKPTGEDIHKYYIDHPELFSDRHVYNLKELEMEAKPELVASVREFAKKGQALEEIATWLKEKSIQSSLQTGVKTSEQLPMEMLAKLSKLPAGQMMVIEMKNSISVLQVVGSKVEPVEEKLATAAIQEFLINSRKKDAIEKEIASLKAGAKIEYYGEFLKGAASAVGETHTVAEVANKPSEQAHTPDVGKAMSSLK